MGLQSHCSGLFPGPEASLCSALSPPLTPVGPSSWTPPLPPHTHPRPSMLGSVLATFTRNFYILITFTPRPKSGVNAPFFIQPTVLESCLGVSLQPMTHCLRAISEPHVRPPEIRAWHTLLAWGPARKYIALPCSAGVSGDRRRRRKSSDPSGVTGLGRLSEWGDCGAVAGVRRPGGEKTGTLPSSRKGGGRIVGRSSV